MRSPSASVLLTSAAILRELVTVHQALTTPAPPRAPHQLKPKKAVKLGPKPLPRLRKERKPSNYIQQVRARMDEHPEEVQALLERLEDDTASPRHRDRAQILLTINDPSIHGCSQLASELGSTTPRVVRTVRRYLSSGIAVVHSDAARTGRPSKFTPDFKLRLEALLLWRPMQLITQGLLHSMLPALAGHAHWTGFTLAAVLDVTAPSIYTYGRCLHLAQLHEPWELCPNPDRDFVGNLIRVDLLRHFSDQLGSEIWHYDSMTYTRPHSDASVQMLALVQPERGKTAAVFTPKAQTADLERLISQLLPAPAAEAPKTAPAEQTARSGDLTFSADARIETLEPSYLPTERRAITGLAHKRRRIVIMVEALDPHAPLWQEVQAQHPEFTVIFAPVLATGTSPTTQLWDRLELDLLSSNQFYGLDHLEQSALSQVAFYNEPENVRPYSWALDALLLLNRRIYTQVWGKRNRKALDNIMLSFNEVHYDNPTQEALKPDTWATFRHLRKVASAQSTTEYDGLPLIDNTVWQSLSERFAEALNGCPELTQLKPSARATLDHPHPDLFSAQVQAAYQSAPQARALLILLEQRVPNQPYHPTLTELRDA